ncbi:MAG: MarR family transcriptional regulator [Actinomycetota bacterium]|nr:MAG: MarR family transcriptional regulator [Actinomycetota bacterium]
MGAVANALQELQRLRASRQVHGALAQAAGVDLSQQAVQVLLALDECRPVAKLARAAHMDIGAVSRQLRVLEEGGYLTRSPSPEGGNVVLVTATSKGRALARRVIAVRNEHLAETLSGWSSVERRRLAELLGRLVGDLQQTPYPTRKNTKEHRS